MTIPKGMVEDIIRIANAGGKERRSFLDKLIDAMRPSIPYGAEEQLKAIGALGVSRSPRALQYLRRLRETRVVEIPDDYGAMFRKVSYVNARGGLRDALEYSEDVDNGVIRRYNSELHGTAHDVLDRAILTLEGDLNYAKDLPVYQRR